VVIFSCFILARNLFPVVEVQVRLIRIIPIRISQILDFKADARQSTAAFFILAVIEWTTLRAF
jgi:hypothetical protein